MKNVVRSFFSYVYVPNEKDLSTLEKPTVAEVLLHGARVVFNMSLYSKRCGGEAHAEVAHSNVVDDVDRANVAMLFVTTGLIESYTTGIT